MASVTPEWLSKMLKRPEVRRLVDEIVHQSLSSGKVRATARLIELLESSSQKVSLEASKHVLAIGGVAPPREGPTLNFNGSGYTIDLRSNPDQPGQVLHNEGSPGAVIIDVTPGDAEKHSPLVSTKSDGYDE
ncbi:MAG: hypothetical protein K5821_13435 [Nitrobacter sp.]|nr:hypothetical protein [Nitrobacter sp.]